MSADHSAFVGSIPENYDRYLGPVLFEPYAADLVTGVRVPEKAKVLELACGTGIVTRRLRDRLHPSIKIVATDLNEAMMSYAARKFYDNENVDWKLADATELPCADQSFDAVICQFGLMFFPDKPKAAAEIYRVLKPGGSCVFNVWDAIDTNDLPRLAHEVVGKYFAENPPTFYNVPFSFYDPDVIRSLMKAAGFRDANVKIVPFSASAAAAEDVAKGLIYGNPIINSIREMDESKAPEIEKALADSIAEKFGNAPVRAHMQAVVCSAIK